MYNIKKKVKEKIKQYSNDEYLDGYIQNEYLTDDEDADIILKLQDRNDLFDSRTVKNQVDLNSRIYTYINEKSSMLRHDIQLHFHIIGLELTGQDKGRIKHIIKEHYAIELYKVQKEYRRYKYRIMRSIVIGIVSFLFYMIIMFYLPFAAFAEIAAFFFSFSLWQAFDMLTNTLIDLRRQRESITQKLVMDVDFELDEDEVI